MGDIETNMEPAGGSWMNMLVNLDENKIQYINDQHLRFMVRHHAQCGRNGFETCTYADVVKHTYLTSNRCHYCGMHQIFIVRKTK